MAGKWAYSGAPCTACPVFCAVIVGGTSVEVLVGGAQVLRIPYSVLLLPSVLRSAQVLRIPLRPPAAQHKASRSSGARRSVWWRPQPSVLQHDLRRHFRAVDAGLGAVGYFGNQRAALGARITFAKGGGKASLALWKGGRRERVGARRRERERQGEIGRDRWGDDGGGGR